VRCPPWPMVAGQVGDEVEEKVVEGGEVEGEVEVGSVWKLEET